MLPSPLAEMLRGVHVDGPSTYVWLGQRCDLGARAEGGDEFAPLRSALEERLYADFFCTGGIAPPARQDDRDRGLDPIPPDELSAANGGRGSPQAGWVLQARDGHSLVVERDGLRLWADPVQVLGPRSPSGREVALLLPKESLGLPRGFYTAYGDAGDAGEAGALDRFYWNVRVPGRPLLVALVTERLNAARLPFRLKVLNDPHDVRCDAGVLYAPRGRRRAVLDLLTGLLPAMSAHLRANVPSLTLPLAAGLSFAEDPPGDASFGEHRCRLLAGALVEAHRKGVSDLSGRAAIIARRWAREGISLDAPHLNPGSDSGTAPAPLA